jgi:predicted GNAT family acetyltransferase
MSLPSELTIEHRIEPSAGAFLLLQRGEQVGEIFYTLEGERVVIEHTEVDPELRGRNLGLELVRAAMAWAREEHRPVRADCPFARKMIARHPELAA